MEQGDFGANFLSALMLASVGGAVFVAVVAALCRLFPRLPASLRFALYFLACVRLLVGLAFAVRVRVTLPASPWTRAFVTTPAPPSAANFGTANLASSAAKTSSPVNASLPSGDSTELANAPQAAEPTTTERSMASYLPMITVSEAVASLYVAGVLVAFFAAASDGRRIHRLHRLSTPVADTSAYADLVTALGLKRMPLIHASAAVTSPVVTGILRPVVLLPTDFQIRLTTPEQRLGVAHELAHIRRHDLALNLLLSMTRALFFFHPLAHFAVRECAAAREECCDALAVRATNATPAQYGRFLVSLAQRLSATGFPPHAANGIGMAAASFLPLRRRLLALGCPTAMRRAPVAVSSALLIGAIGGTLPVQLVGATEAPPPSSEPDLPRYHLIDLGTLGGQSSDATAITDKGLIVGGSNYNPHAIWGHAYSVTIPGDSLRDLAVPTRFLRSVAHSANDRGDIAVETFARPGRPSALIVGADGKTTRTITGSAKFPFARPMGINDSGDVAGAIVSSHSDGTGATPTHAFLVHGGALRDIGTLGGAYSLANAVSASGVVVGKSDIGPDADGRVATHAFFSPDGVSLRDLGALPGGTNSVANAIDALNRIVGTSDTIDGTRHAFLAEVNGSMRDLGSLTDFPASHALGITSGGVIVGTAYSGDESASSDHRAVAWQLSPRTGALLRLVDLNDRIPAASGWTLEIARSVNSSGQIVGQGLYNGRRRAFLLNPIPGK